MRATVLRTLTLAVVFAGLAAADLLAAGGTIEGTVVFNGRPRRNPLIQMGADPNCLSINAGQKVVQELVALNDDKSVSNVFVHIVDDVAHGGGTPEPLVIDQRGCIYHPRIAGAMVGQVLRVHNSDSTLHNIHTVSESGNGINVGQPKVGMEYDHTLRGEEVMLRLKCDVHPWMVGFVGVKKHPYHAVSGEGGAFRIEGVPAGSYTLQAWQERLGTVEETIEVKGGETTTVAFAYGGAQSSAAAPGLPVRELRLETATHARD